MGEGEKTLALPLKKSAATQAMCVQDVCEYTTHKCMMHVTTFYETVEY